MANPPPAVAIGGVGPGIWKACPSDLGVIFPSGRNSNPGPNMVNGKPAMQHHIDRGSDSDFCDPSDWTRASYSAHPIDEIEPIDLTPNGYRAAALAYLKVMLAVDEFVMMAPDARVAVVAVAVVLGWPSARGLSISNIANQLGCTPAALTRSIARFKTLAGLDSDGSIQRIRPGAGSSNSDKPAAARM